MTATQHRGVLTCWGFNKSNNLKGLKPSGYLKVLEGDLLLPLFICDEIAHGLNTGWVVLHVEGDWPSGLCTTSDVIELETHERLHKSCTTHVTNSLGAS